MEALLVSGSRGLTTQEVEVDEKGEVITLEVAFDRITNFHE